MIDSIDVLRVQAIKERGNSNLNLNLWKETGQDTYFGSNNLWTFHNWVFHQPIYYYMSSTYNFYDFSKGFETEYLCDQWERTCIHNSQPMRAAYYLIDVENSSVLQLQ